MKRTIALFLVIALLCGLTACGKADSSVESQVPVSETPAPTDTPTPTPEPTPEPEPASVSEVEPEPTPESFKNPLTGEPTEYDLSSYRPVVAMLNTIKQALPQSSNGQADMLFEIPEEGGITRVMALYQDITGIGNIGTIRSTRDYYLQLAMGLDAIMIHAGCSTIATEMLENTGYDTLDFMSHGSLYWRDSYRKENVGTEHSLYTSSDNILGYLGSSGFRTTHEEGFSYPFTFTEDGTPAGGSSATDIEVSFSGYKHTRFVYNAETGLYDVYAYGDPYMDDNTGTQVSVKNVIVIPTAQTTVEDGLQAFDLTSGTGYFACGGQYIPINWEKGDLYECLRFSLTDGTPLNLGVGRSYICICDTGAPVTVQ